MQSDILLVGERIKAHIDLQKGIEGGRYTAVSTVEEGVEKMQSISFDLVIIDREIDDSDRALIRKMLELQQPDALLLETDANDRKSLLCQVGKHIQSLRSSQMKATYIIKDDVFTF